MSKHDTYNFLKCEAVKKYGVGGYHEIFENKKPQINADQRGFVIAYLRLFAFICGFWILTPKNSSPTKMHLCSSRRSRLAKAGE